MFQNQIESISISGWQEVGLILFLCLSMLFTWGLASEPLEKALTSAKADLWGFECSPIMKPFLLCLQHLISGFKAYRNQHCWKWEGGI